MDKKENKKEWILSLVLVVALTLASGLMMKLGTFLINHFFLGVLPSGEVNLISSKEGAFLVALEMGFIPMFAVLAIGIVEKWPKIKILGIAWKVLIIGFLLGAVIGSTYTNGSQSLLCGILH